MYYYYVHFKWELIFAIKIILQTVEHSRHRSRNLLLACEKNRIRKCRLLNHDTVRHQRLFSEYSPRENYNVSVLYDRSGTRYLLIFYFFVLSVSRVTVFISVRSNKCGIEKIKINSSSRGNRKEHDVFTKLLDFPRKFIFRWYLVSHIVRWTLYIKYNKYRVSTKTEYTL